MFGGLMTRRFRKAITSGEAQGCKHQDEQAVSVTGKVVTDEQGARKAAGMLRMNREFCLYSAPFFCYSARQIFIIEVLTYDS